MSTPNPFDTQTDLSRVLAKIAEIAGKAADGDYIYRGESKFHDKVSSSLYREHPHIEGVHFDIVEAQEIILEEAKAYIGATDDIDETDNIGILTQLQHFGGKTNLIDFTEDYLIALFFACDGSHEEEGRVILLKRESNNYEVEKPRRIIDRVESQKSVFVESPEGFIQPDIVVPIPVDLKMPILNYLRKYHRISIETIYNDLHGFIRRSAYTELLKGITYHGKVDEAETREKKDEHLENAIRHYTEALKLKPDLWSIYTNRGAAYADKGEFDAAIQDYTKAIELNPELADAYYNRGIAYADKGEFDAAIQNYTKAIELNPELADAYYNRGIAYADKGDLDTAIQDYNTAIDLNPDDANAYHNRGAAYANKGELDAAIQDFSNAVELKPDHANAYNNRGAAYANKGELDAAIQDFSKTIELKPDYAEAYYNRGIAYANKGELDAAIQDFNKVIELNPDYTEVYNNRGAAYADKGEFDAAIQDLRKAIELNPDDADAYYNRGITWLHQQEWEKAKADLTEAQDKEFDIAAQFHNDYETIEAFEATLEVQVPEDLATLLTGDQN